MNFLAHPIYASIWHKFNNEQNLHNSGSSGKKSQVFPTSGLAIIGVLIEEWAWPESDRFSVLEVGTVFVKNRCLTCFVVVFHCFLEYL